MNSLSTQQTIYTLWFKKYCDLLDDIKKHEFLNKNMWQLEKELSQKWA